jgi:ATP-binding cassette subfamily B protein
MNHFLKKVQAWAYRFVPHHVNDRLLLTILSLLSVTGVPRGKRQRHEEQNNAAWERYQRAHRQDIYLEHQEDMKEIRYGNHSADYNTCEVIAVCNALAALHDGTPPVSFPALLSVFEKRGITAGGAFGTSPRALCRYLKTEGFRTQMLCGKKINEKTIENLQKNNDTFLMTAYNDANDLGKMIHTVSITEKNERFTVHNASDNAAYPTLAAAVLGYRGGIGRAICLIGVKKAL